jgi:hypothetical protein
MSTKRVVAVLFLIVFAAEIYAETSQQAWNEERVLWFKKPAKEWKVALPDGSIHPEDIKTLNDVGEHIRKHGWPS